MNQTLPFSPRRVAPALAAAAIWLWAIPLQAQAWRSTLYPENWQRPGETASFSNDKLIQDFSYAGYRRGEEEIPQVAGPVFDATAYGADPTGGADSTAAIQSAINAAAAAGGGVVFLPAGEFRISPQGSNAFSLRISTSNIVLRGAGAAKTFLLNTSTSMRGKKVLSISPLSVTSGPEVNLSADCSGPTRRIRVASPSAFAPGDVVRLQWSFTDDWITEHNQQTWWNATNGRPSAGQYLREILSVNPVEGWIEIDVPTRYGIKTRDAARVSARTGMLRGVGIESLAMGNLQHPGTTWGENDYNDPAKPAYDVHGGYVIEMRDSLDSWISGVESYQPVANSSTCHMLSNGILLLNCFRVTVADCKMRRPQYGGGGGNGYMFRLQNSNDCLVRNCLAAFSRHGIVTSHAGTTGNVFLRCEDRDTARATGNSGSYTTSGSGSDNHMHFSHSNLWDGCLAHNSFFSASHRGTSGTVPHGLTSAHSVYWNTTGSGTRYTNIVLNSQGRYGYIIGTSGSRFGATNPTTGNTAPADHLEGIGTGNNLEPASLYLDQLARRIEPRLTLTSADIRFPNNTFTIKAGVTIDGQTVTAPTALSWNLLSSPAGARLVSSAAEGGRSFTASRPGSYTIGATGIQNGKAFSGTITVEALPPATTGPIIELPPVADSYVRGGTDNQFTNFGNATTMMVKKDGGAHVEREAFMRFDFRGVDPTAIEQSSLHLHFTSTATDANGRTTVVNDPDNWGELTINWSNRPTVQKVFVGDWTPVAGDWRVLDASGVIPSGLETGNTITFRHQITSQSSASVYSIASGENANASLRPFLRLQMAPPSLDAWLTATAGLAISQITPGDDPDGDGISNLLEAWLGTRADLPDMAALPRIARRNGQWMFDLELNPNPPVGLFYYLESSDSLGNDWQLVPGVIWENNGPLAHGRQPMTARLPEHPSSGRRFYRFAVLTP